MGRCISEHEIYGEDIFHLLLLNTVINVEPKLKTLAARCTMIWEADASGTIINDKDLLHSY